MTKNNAELDVTVRYGKFAAGPRRREQKAVDVLLAVDAVTFAARQLCDAVVLVSGDADFIPVVDAVKDAGPLMAVCVFRSSFSADLIAVADRVGYFPSDPSQLGGILTLN